MSDIHDSVEEEIVVSPMMKALSDYKYCGSKDEWKYAAGVELEIRKLIMGGISHVEQVRMNMMSRTFQPFPTGVPGDPGIIGSSGNIGDPGVKQSDPSIE